MRIASIDIETTGQDPEKHQVLEIGVVLWDTVDMATPVEALPHWHCYVKHLRIVGEARALVMNAPILDAIDRGLGLHLEPEMVGPSLANWLWEVYPGCVLSKACKRKAARISPTGFNFDGFDRQFLNRLPGFSDVVDLGHRSLSPATLFFSPGDDHIPGSDEVFRRAGVSVVDRHTAIGDARATIEVLRAAFRCGSEAACYPPVPRDMGPDYPYGHGYRDGFISPLVEGFNAR